MVKNFTRALLALTVLMISPLRIHAAVTPVTDKDISRAIERNLSMDCAVSPHFIDINIKNGKVTLSGSVDNLIARDRAAKIAQSLKGVSSVVNNIVVRPVERSDSEIKQDVDNVLNWDPATAAYKLDTQVKDGVVTMSGEAGSWAEKELSEQVIKNVKGIKDIKNNVEIKYAQSRSDKEIQADIEAHIKSNPYVNREAIDIEVKDGQVFLSGSVDSLAEKSQAYHDSWVNGVSGVNIGNLIVKSWVKPEKPPRPTVITDPNLELAVKENLAQNPRVMAFDILVESKKGVVTLTGFVDNLKAKSEAEKVTRNTSGVKEVENLIKVRPVQTQAEMDLISRIRTALESDPILEQYEFTVFVRNNKAYLSGRVFNFYSKYKAEDIASRILGVAAVENNIIVDLNTPIWRADEQLKENVGRSYFWSWKVDGDQITINVKDGVVTLSGTVDNLQKANVAIAKAFEAGAGAVKSELKTKEGDNLYGMYFPSEYNPFKVYEEVAGDDWRFTF